MKYRLIIILFFVSCIVYSQERFNVILEDSVTHIASNVAETGSGYIVLSGTSNEYNLRSFALTKVSLTGNILEKNVIGTDSVEYWEGLKHCLKFNNDHFYFSGTIKSGSGKYGMFIFNSDNSLISPEFFPLDYDSIWKSAYNITASPDAYYITGQHYNPEAEYAQLFISKVDTLGNKIWKKLYGNVYESGDQIILTSDNYLVTGGLTHQSLTSNSNWYIIKTDTAGNLQWEKNYGHSARNDGAVSALQETPDSCILACGSYPGIKAMVDTYYDGCIRKIDKAGELMWEKHYRSYLLSHTGKIYTTNYLYSIISEGDAIYAIGKNYNYNSWLDRVYLLRLNKYGDIIWKRNYYAVNEDSHSQQLNTFKRTMDGGFILAGYGNDYEDQGYYPPQQRWLIKTDSLGMDGLCNTEPDALEVDIDLPEQMCAFDTLEVYAYIAGPTAPYTIGISNGQQIDSIYYPPVFVPVEIGPGTIEINYDATTVMEFEEPVVTLSNHEWGECIAIPIEYYVGNQMGTQNINITVTDGWGNSKTITKPVYVKTCPDGISDGSFNPLQIYPNPASDVLTIEFAGNNRSLPIRIYDLQGKEVLTSQFANSSSSIDISELPAGTYRIVIGSFGKSFSVVR